MMRISASRAFAALLSATLGLLALIAPTAQAAEAPILSKERATVVGEATAALAATINPGERKTRYRFQYIDDAGSL